MALGRGEREWTLLVSEYNICKKKLESKREALQILMKDLKTCQRERDIYKNKIYQLQQENDRLKWKEERDKAAAKAREAQAREKVRLEREKREKEDNIKGYGHSVWDQELQSIRQKKNQTLSQLLNDTREENKALQNDLVNLRQLYKEAQEDILLLRENIAKQSSTRSGQGDATQDVSMRQDLIIQLEEQQEKTADLERDLQAAVDEKNEVSVERDHFRDKSERLNTQLNYILGADDRRLVDIDAVLMENRYMKEQIKQLKEEKGLASAAVARYKAAFDKRRNKLRKAIYNEQSSFTKHTLSSLLQDLSGVQGGHVSATTIADLQFLANSLSESLTDKDIALSHQKNTNKILGVRVAELEKKLKTLEVAGLWSLPGHRGYGSKDMEIVNEQRVQSGNKELKLDLVESPAEDIVDGNDSNNAEHSQEDLHDIRARLMLSSTGTESDDEFDRNPMISPEEGLTDTDMAEEELLVNVATSPPSTEHQVAESCIIRGGCVTNELNRLSGSAQSNETTSDNFVINTLNGFEEQADGWSRESKTSKINSNCTSVNGHGDDVNDYSVRTYHTENSGSDHDYGKSDEELENICRNGSLSVGAQLKGDPLQGASQKRGDTLQGASRCLSPDSAAFEAEVRELTLRVSDSGSEAGSESEPKTAEEEYSEYAGYVDTDVLGDSTDPNSPVRNTKAADEKNEQQELATAKECLSDSELAQLLYNVSSAEEF